MGGRPFPTPRPSRPCPGNPGLPPHRGASRPAQHSTPQRRRLTRRPRGTRRGAGRPEYGGRARSPRGPPAQGLAGTPTPPHTPTPARRPRRSPCSGPGWTHVRLPAVAARGRPRGPQVPRPRHPSAGPSHPFILSGAWRGPANPRPHVSGLAARPAYAAQPAALREPGDVGRAWGRLCLPFSCFFFFLLPPFSLGWADRSE